MIAPLPSPDLLAVAAWIVAAVTIVAAVAARRPLGPAWLLGALLSAALGQLGTLRAVPGALPTSGDPIAAASAGLAAAVAPEAHGYLAAALAAAALTAIGWRRSPERRRARWAGAATAGVCGALGIGAAVGAASAWLVGLGALAVGVAVLVGARRSAGLAASGLLAVAFAWLGARHFLLFAQHHALVVDAGPLLERSSGALEGLMVAGPGVLVAVAAAGLGAAGSLRPTAAGGAVALALLGVVSLGAVNTRALGPLRLAVAGGALPEVPPERLPAVDGGAAVASCVAWPSDDGWSVASRWGGAVCPDRSRVAVGAPADAPAAEVVAAPWLDDDAVLEFLVRPDPGALRGARRARAWRVRPVQWVDAPVPSAFSGDLRLGEQLEDWLDARLGVLRPDGAVPGSVWVVDAPQGDMILMTRGAVTAEDPAHRREILGRLLATGDLPRLVLVLGDRWTVQDALTLCADAEAAVPSIPCVWVRRPR